MEFSPPPTNPGPTALEYGVALVGVVCAVAFCVWFARSNYLAYVLVFGMGAVHAALTELRAGNAGLAMQGWIVVAVAVAALVWAVGPGLVGGGLNSTVD